MLDFRVKTFLELCETGSYTKAAQHLHITQPAVTQHIHYLEEDYGVKLFTYQGRELRLTEAGKRFREFGMSVRADDDRIRKRLALSQGETAPLRFGATLTIGEYTMPGILKRALEEMPDLRLTMQVKNTQELLAKLERGEVDFALVEGNFDRSKYDARVFSQEEMVGICGPDWRADRMPDLPHRKFDLEELLEERLIVREAGSGTRGVLQQALYEHNLNLNAFAKVTQLGSMEAIKSLVSAGCGIAFLYREAVKKELALGTLCQFRVKDFLLTREFHFVSLKGSVQTQEQALWFERFFRWRGEC